LDPAISELAEERPVRETFVSSWLTQQLAYATIAQPEPSPYQASEHEGEDHIEPARLNANLAGDSAAEISRQQNGP
jgi:hypothetical protein